MSSLSLADILAAKPDPRFASAMSWLSPERPPLVIDGVTQRAIRCGADVVAGLNMPSQEAQSIVQSIDDWAASGRIGTPTLPPGIDPASARIMSLRLSALAKPRPPMPLTTAIGSPFQGPEPMHKSDATPPQAVRDACKRGLDLAPEHGGPGLTEGAKARARSMAAGNAVSAENLKRMVSFFARHGSYPKESSPPSPGYVSWQLWGGDAGKRWANSQADDSETEKSRLVVTSLAKARGAGSRGGDVIGRTRSGKAIYASHHAGHEHYSGFSGADHMNAADIHDKVADKHEREYNDARSKLSAAGGSSHGNMAEAMVRARVEAARHSALRDTHAFRARHAEKSCHTREYHSGKYAPRTTEKGKTPKWKKQGLIGPGGAWATAKRKAKEKGKPESYAKKIYMNMTGHKSETE